MNTNEIDQIEIDIRLSMLKHWYGDQLTDEQWEGVREGIREEIIEVSQAIRAVELGYADEPLPLFFPYRSED